MKLNMYKMFIKKRIQSEVDSFFYQADQLDTIVVQDILYVDRISI